VGKVEGSPEYHYNLGFRENLGLETFMSDGLISNWDMLEKTWDHMIKDHLRVETSETPVLFAEKPYNTSYCRQKMCEILFEKYQSPAVFVSKDAVLECYSVGRTTGLVIDVGGNGTVLTPVVDGWVESRAINRTFIGGQYMDAYMLGLMRKRLANITSTGAASSSSSIGIPNLVPQFRIAKTVVGDRVTSVSLADLKNVHPTYDAFMNLELARDIKESVCRMGDSAVTEFDPRYCNLPAQVYELPDGTVIDVGVERFLVPELLCDWSAADIRLPDLVALGLAPPADSDASSNPVFNTSLKTIPKMALDSILKCDTDSHSSLLAGLVVAGGGSSIDGVPDRLRAEIEQLVHSSAPSAWKVKMTAAGNNERPLSCWIGGSILASLGSFHEMWMTKAEYAEFGSSLVDKKCP
jgi:actin-like protein 6A